MSYHFAALGGIILFIFSALCPGTRAAEVPAMTIMNEQTEHHALQEAYTGPTASGVTRVTLKNGMTVLLEENHSSPVVAVNVWVKVGSACEEEGEYGLAHVHEHMVFKGTEKRGVGEIARMIESNGGDINAFTSFDHTVYFVEIASRFLDTAIDVLSDAMQNSSFDPDELAKELEVVVEEISRGEDSPMRVLSQRMFATAYGTHTYRLPIIGTKESVRSFDRAKVVNFYEKWYRPNNMTLVLVGDFDTRAVLAKVEATFGAQEPLPVPECDLPPEPVQESLRAFVLDKEVQEGYFYLAYHIGDTKHEDTPTADVVANILGGGDSSRLYRNIKEEKGLVNSIYAYSYTPKDPGIFVISGSFDPDQAGGALMEILKEVELLKDTSITPDELARAKVNIESESIYAKETMNGQAQKLGYYEADGGDYLFEKVYLDGIAKVTADSVSSFSRRRFGTESLTVGLLLPTGRVTMSEEDIRELVARVEPGTPGPYYTAGEPRAEEGHEGYGEKRAVLTNGIRVIVKESHAVPTFAARAVLMGGVRYETGENNGISNFVAEMLTRGTLTRTSEDIAREIDGLAGGIEGFSGRNSFGVRLEALSKNFTEAMDVFTDVIKNPSFEPEEIERARKDILADINREGDNLVRTTVNLFVSTLYESHPYRLNPLGTPGVIEALGRDELRAFYTRISSPENLVVTVAGDVNAADVIATLEKSLGSIEKTAFEPLVVTPEPAVTGGPRTAEIEKQDKAQTHIIMGFLAPTIYDPDHYAFEVLSTILSGQGGRLFLELRDRQSLAYTVTSFLTPGLEPGFFGVYIGTAPDKRSTAIKAIKEQLALVLEKGVSGEELQRAQNYLVGSFEINLQQNSSQASQLGFDELYGLGWDNYKQFSTRIYAVTTGDVLRVARRYIDLDNYVLTVVSPGS